MTRDHIGRSLRRLEDERFLTGQGRYVDDIAVPGQLHGVVLRSPHGHASIEGIDAAAARTNRADEFIRRFLLHVLPKGFHRIRHYGLLASAGCKANIARAKKLMAAPMPEIDPPAARDTADPHTTTDHRPSCPCCGGRMIIVEVFAPGGAPRGPPSSGPGIRTATP